MSEEGNLLAYDLATCTGRCVGTGDGLPEVSHIELPSSTNNDRGPLFSCFRRAVVNDLATYQPSRVIFEAPILPKAFIKWVGQRPVIVYPTNIATTTLLQGLAAILEMECYDAKVPISQTDVGTIKKQLTGNGKAEKPDMVRAAERCGLTIEVHDEADAFGCWLVGLCIYRRAKLQAFDRLLYGPTSFRRSLL